MSEPDTPKEVRWSVEMLVLSRSTPHSPGTSTLAFRDERPRGVPKERTSRASSGANPSRNPWRAFRRDTASAAAYHRVPIVSPIELDTPLIARLREHLLRLARASFEPVHGGRRVDHDSPEEQAVIERFRPFAELFLLVAFADGKVVDAERAVLLGSFRALTGGRVSGSTLKALEEEIRGRMQLVSREDLMEDVCARLSSSRQDAELALTLASVVASADDDVDPSELELIQTLASWLSIPRERVRELVTGSDARAETRP